MIIAVDIDNTLHDYHRQLAEVVKARTGLELPYADHRQYGQLVDLLDGDKALAYELYNACHAPDLVLSATVYPGAVEVMERWQADGHQLLIMSQRHEHTRPATEQWLAEQGIPYELLVCDMNKLGRMDDLGVEVVVDDHPHTIVESLIAGRQVATLLHPWTVNFRAVARVVCAEDWRGIEAGLALEHARQLSAH